jgi:hypothetical protein
VDYEGVLETAPLFFAAKYPMRQWINLFEKNLLSSKLKRVGSPYADDPDFACMIPSAIAYWPNGLTLDDFNGDYTTLRKTAKKTMMTVPHNLMVSGQLRVTQEGVDEYLDGKVPDRPVQADFWQGRYILLDGHHRVVADILMGKTTTMCEVRDMDAIFDWEGYPRTAESDPELDRFDWSSELTTRP